MDSLIYYIKVLASQAEISKNHLLSEWGSILIKETLFYLVCLLSDLARSYTNRLSHVPMHRNNLPITSLLSYINEHYQTLTLEELAEQFHYSTRTISNFIQRETGKSFRETLQNYRLIHACRYLTKTDISLNDLPELVGYSQRTAFERIFKKYFHCTPAQYRKNHQSYG